MLRLAGLTQQRNGSEFPARDGTIPYRVRQIDVGASGVATASSPLNFANVNDKRKQIAPRWERGARPSETSAVIAKPRSMMIERAKRREPRALEAFVLQHEAALYRYFQGPRHWHRTLVPDLVQETLARAIKSFPKFLGTTEEQAQRWLFGIARNVHLQEISRRVGRRLREDVAKELARLRIDSSADHVGRAHFMGDILSALKQLPLPQLEALRLLLEGKTTREIAAELGVAEGTVASRVHRARNQLRQRLGIQLDSR